MDFLDIQEGDKVFSQPIETNDKNTGLMLRLERELWEKQKITVNELLVVGKSDVRDRDAPWIRIALRYQRGSGGLWMAEREDITALDAWLRWDSENSLRFLSIRLGAQGSEWRGAYNWDDHWNFEVVCNERERKFTVRRPGIPVPEVLPGQNSRLEWLGLTPEYGSRDFPNFAKYRSLWNNTQP